MKRRSGFVSNSSSSSFIVFKRFLSPHQIDQIKDHSQLGEEMGLDWANDSWSIHDRNDSVEGYTTMDNFDMGEFLNLIGVDPDKVTWEY